MCIVRHSHDGFIFVPVLLFFFFLNDILPPQKTDIVHTSTVCSVTPLMCVAVVVMMMLDHGEMSEEDARRRAEATPSFPVRRARTRGAIDSAARARERAREKEHPSCYTGFNAGRSGSRRGRELIPAQQDSREI